MQPCKQGYVEKSASSRRWHKLEQIFIHLIRHRESALLSESAIPIRSLIYLTVYSGSQCSGLGVRPDKLLSTYRKGLVLRYKLVGKLEDDAIDPVCDKLACDACVYDNELSAFLSAGLASICRTIILSGVW